MTNNLTILGSKLWIFAVITPMIIPSSNNNFYEIHPSKSFKLAVVF